MDELINELSMGKYYTILKVLKLFENCQQSDEQKFYVNLNFIFKANILTKNPLLFLISSDFGQYQMKGFIN